MNLTQAFKMAVKSIWAKKMRSFLTMLGIIIGIAAVMTIVSVVDGANQKNMEYYEAMGTNRVSVNAYLNGGNAFEEVYNYCQGIEEVVGVTPNIYANATVKYGTKNSGNMEWPPELYLGSDQYSLCNNFKIDKGRDISFMDVEGYNPVCVLGARAVKEFFDSADPIGKQMTLNGANFTVIGVYHEKHPNPGSYSMDNVIIMPYTAARYLGQENNTGEFVVKVRDSASINKVITLLNGNFSAWNETGQGNFWCYSDESWKEQNKQMSLMMSLVLGAIAGISLLVGGIGIMNIMLVTVTERTREIGIRRAIGAEQKSIVAQFLIEAAVICGIGGIFGVLLGFLGTAVAGKLIVHAVVLPSPVVALGAFLFSVLLGILFGLFPAVKASKLQPVVALRAE